jgi:hypothetical protein
MAASRHVETNGVFRGGEESTRDGGGDTGTQAPAERHMRESVIPTAAKRLSRVPQVYDGHARSHSRRHAESAQAEPGVTVKIGRVEVRAVFPETPPGARTPAPGKKPALTLEDYLKRRNEERR